MPGRPAQPLELAKLKGACRQNPQRYRDAPEGNPTPMGQPPENMVPEAKVIWYEILEMMPHGVITHSDRFAVETLANVMLEYRKDPFGFPAMKHRVIDRKLSELGLTPAARRKVAVVAQKPKESGFAEFVTKQ